MKYDITIISCHVIKKISQRILKNFHIKSKLNRINAGIGAFRAPGSRLQNASQIIKKYAISTQDTGVSRNFDILQGSRGGSTRSGPVSSPSIPGAMKLGLISYFRGFKRENATFEILTRKSGLGLSYI